MVNVDLIFRMKKRNNSSNICIHLTSGSVYLGVSEGIALGKKVKESRKEVREQSTRIWERKGDLSAFVEGDHVKLKEPLYNR